MRHEFVSIILMNDFAYVKHVMFVGLTFCVFFVGVGSGSCSDTSRGDVRLSYHGLVPLLQDLEGRGMVIAWDSLP